MIFLSLKLSWVFTLLFIVIFFPNHGLIRYFEGKVSPKHGNCALVWVVIRLFIYLFGYLKDSYRVLFSV